MGESQPSPTTTVVFGGDLMIGRSFERKTVQSPWTPSVRKLLERSHLFCVNLETSVTTATEPWPDKVFHFKVAPRTFGRLLPRVAIASPTAATTTTGIPMMMVNLANNHILDYKEAGLHETTRTLDRLGIPFAGIKGRRFPAVVTLATGLVVGMVGWTDHPAEWRGRGGVQFFDPATESWAAPLRTIKQAASQVDVLVVYLHFGSNWVTRVPLLHRKWAQACIDAGARVVVNSSAHHVLPVVRYRSGLILYSPGAVVDDYAVDPRFRNDLGLLVEVTFDSGQGTIVSYKLHPTRISSGTVSLLSPDRPEYKWVTRKVSAF